MLGTVMNALAIEGALLGQGADARAMSAVAMPTLCDTYERNMARRHMEAGRVVVLGGGTGNPLFTTDTAAALRASELSCDVLLKATNVDGVYSADPKTDRNASRFDRLTHADAISRDLKIMDTAAFALARESRLPILVFSIQEPGAITAVLTGRGRATEVVP
jgi:uridylate kinase